MKVKSGNNAGDQGRWTVLAGAAGVALAAVVAVTAVRAGDEDVNAVIVKIMKSTHKGDKSMAKRAIIGKATPEEIDTLLADYKTMADEKPPRGSAESWKTKMAKLIDATEALKAAPDDKAAQAKFKTAVACKGCHEAHKPQD